MTMKTRARILSVLGMLSATSGLGCSVYFGQSTIVIAFNALMTVMTLVVGLFAWKVTLR